MTVIKVNGEHWGVPRGHGAAYKRAARQEARPEVLRDLMEMVGYTASVATIASWPLRKRIETEVYCANVHLRASGHGLSRHPRPTWMPEPWLGPRRGDGIWENAGPTEVP